MKQRIEYASVQAATQSVLNGLAGVLSEFIMKEHGFSSKSLSYMISETEIRIRTNDDNDLWFRVYIVPQEGESKYYEYMRTIIINFSQYGVTRDVDVILSKKYGKVDFVFKRLDMPSDFSTATEFTKCLSMIMSMMEDISKDSASC